MDMKANVRVAFILLCSRQCRASVQESLQVKELAECAFKAAFVQQQPLANDLLVVHLLFEGASSFYWLSIGYILPPIDLI
jgi:hypothetical protein